MSQITTWTITLVYDDLALQGGQWWARGDTDLLEGDGAPVVTTLCADPVDALDEVTRLLGFGITTTEA